MVFQKPNLDEIFVNEEEWQSVGNASSAAQAAMMAEDPQNKKKDEPVASEVKTASPADTYINEVLDALSEKESVIDALLKNMAVYFETLK